MPRKSVFKKEDLQNVLDTMRFLRRESGYVAVDEENKLRFFESEPIQGSAFITREDILWFIDNYK